jgi:DNA-binding transcriptional LysR family regulator
VSAAARRLNLSQPATSAALARLRRALDDPLLVRAGSQMTPTPRAEELRPKVRQLLADIEQTFFRRTEFDPTLSDRAFRLAANDYAVNAVLSPLAQRLRRLSPRTRLEILPLEDDFERRLANDDYDIAIRDRWSLRSSQRLETLFHEDYVCIVRKGHPRLSRKPTLEEFLSEGHVLISPRGRSPGVVDAALDRIKRKLRVAVTLPYFLAAPAVVARTDFIMTIAHRVALQLAPPLGLRIFASPIQLRGFEVAMAWRRRTEADAAVSWLKEQLRQVV